MTGRLRACWALQMRHTTIVLTLALVALGCDAKETAVEKPDAKAEAKADEKAPEAPEKAKAPPAKAEAPVDAKSPEAAG